MSESADQIRTRLTHTAGTWDLPHIVVDKDGAPVSEPFPDRDSAWREAMYRNGMAGKPLYDVRPHRKEP